MLLADLTDLVALYGEAPDGDWVALEQGSRRATMRDLRGWMESAAGALHDGSDDVVVVSTEDVVEHAVGYLGALAAGRRPLLVDPKHPQSLLQEMAGRAGATVAVGRTIAGLTSVSWDELTGGPSRERARVSPEHAGAILLTSGSTSEPKLVVRSRGADLAAAYNFRLARFPVMEGSRFWLFVPYTGSPWAGIAWNVLLARATVVVAPFQADDIGGFLAENTIAGTFLGATPTRLAYERDGLVGPGWGGLEAILSGGEKLDEPTAKIMLERWPNAVFIAYGATEVTQLTLSPLQDVIERPGTVGRPLPVHQAKIDEAGELLMRGPDMFSGYLGEEPAGDWYRTGDLAHLDADGYVYITGRASNMVQIGGNRVSTEEVTAELRSHPAIANATVIALDDETWGARLEAFVVGAGEDVDAAALDAWLRERLAAFKLPRRFHFLDEMPTESSGKVSLRTLRKLAED